MQTIEFLIFVLILVLVVCGITKYLEKKFNIEGYGWFSSYKWTSEDHLIGEIIIFVLIFALILIGDLVFGYIDFEVYYFLLNLTIAYIFRTYMEWKNNRSAKKYILWLFNTAVTFILFLSLEFVFYNPVPVKVEADQVEKIFVESLKYGEADTITVTDKEFIESVVTMVEKGSYKMGRMSAFNPRLEITIIRDDGREIIIREAQYRNFMISTERFLFPEEMILLSQDLGIIFDGIANKIDEKH